MPVWGGLSFQNGGSFIMEQLIFFHDYTMMVMFMIMILVGYVLCNSYLNSCYNLSMFEGQELESIWTILPALFLLLIAFPSLRLLYLMEEYGDYDMTLKSYGHQWFWSYEYGDLSYSSFESYMVDGVFRLLNVDNCLIVPCGMMIRNIVSSSDVIHSWTLPSMGMKIDAVPGRLNQLTLMFNRVGMHFGQCSEICGSNHSFMPISIFVTPLKELLKIL